MVKRYSGCYATRVDLVGDDVNTAPRSELCSCLVSSRVYCLIKEQLASFLAEFKGKVSFEIIGDSMIVLNQIKSHSYNFHTYAAARIQEIIESTLGYSISWLHVSSQNNVADILTRKFVKNPCELPWVSPSMIISEESLDMTEIPMSSLHNSTQYTGA